MSKVKMQFDPDLAKEIGVEEAIMYSNIEYWCAHNQANRVNFHEGRYWTYNSISAFTELFTFWTEKQIRRILDNLVKKGYVLVGEFADNKYDRTKWYSVLSQTGDIDLPKRANGGGDMGNSTYTDNKPNKEKQIYRFIPPTLSEVEAYFSEKGYSKVAAKKAFDYYEAGNWSDSKGQKVKNWKQKMNGVWFKEENRATVEVSANRTAVGIRPEFGWVMFSDGSYKTVPQKEIEAIQANNELLKNYR